MFLVAILLAATLDTAAIPRMTVEEARALQQKGDAVLIDVRGSVPWELGHIDGAVWLPLGLINQRAGELPEDKTVIAYCTCKSEEVSLEAAASLQKLGFKKVAVLTGGYPAWVAAGYPVSKTEEAPAMSTGGRIGTPAALNCDRSKITAYAGQVTAFKRTKAKTTLTVRTDGGETEKIVLTGDPLRYFLILGTPMTERDWNRVKPGLRARVWVCDGRVKLVDWRPGETAADDAVR
jgi:rhodanese-related sulfurtransferase